MRLLPPNPDVLSVAVGDASAVRAPDGTFDVPDAQAPALLALGWSQAPELEHPGAIPNIGGGIIPFGSTVRDLVRDGKTDAAVSLALEPDPREAEVREAVASGMDEAEARAIVYGDAHGPAGT